MHPRLWIALSVLSLLLSLLLIVFWVRSHYAQDLIVYSSGNRDYHEYVSIPGQFRFTRVQGWTGKQPVRWFARNFPPTRPVFGQQAVYRTWTALGIGFDGGVRRIPVSETSPSPSVVVSYQIVAVPFAVPTLVTGAIGLLPWLRSWRSRILRQERLKRGLCPSCGYDLRATTDRCPECGQALSSHHTPAT